MQYCSFRIYRVSSGFVQILLYHEYPEDWCDKNIYLGVYVYSDLLHWHWQNYTSEVLLGHNTTKCCHLYISWDVYCTWKLKLGINERHGAVLVSIGCFTPPQPRRSFLIVSCSIIERISVMARAPHKGNVVVLQPVCGYISDGTAFNTKSNIWLV